MVCLHLPDYTSEQVSHLMSLLYYGEVWLTMAKFSKEFSTLIRDLDITANLTFRTPRTDVKMEEEEEVVVEEEEEEEGETAAHKKEVLRDTVIDLTTVEDLQVRALALHLEISRPLHFFTWSLMPRSVLRVGNLLRSFCKKLIS